MQLWTIITFNVYSIFKSHRPTDYGSMVTNFTLELNFHLVEGKCRGAKSTQFPQEWTGLRLSHKIIITSLGFFLSLMEEEKRNNLPPSTSKLTLIINKVITHWYNFHYVSENNQSVLFFKTTMPTHLLDKVTNYMANLKYSIHSCPLEKFPTFLSHAYPHKTWWKKWFGIWPPFQFLESGEQGCKWRRDFTVLYILTWDYSKTLKLLPRMNYRLQTLCC